MKNGYLLLIAILCQTFILANTSYSQNTDCGNNAGFENGTTAGWTCIYGSYGSGPCPIGTCPAFITLLNYTGILNTSGINAPITSTTDRHTIMTGAGKDANSNNVVPYVDPGGGNYSFRLGNGVTGGGTSNGYAQATGITLTFVVTPENAGYTYKYAAFLQDPGHPPESQPRFEIIVMDSAANTIPCGYYKVVAGTNNGCPGTSGFSNGVGDWKYTNWTTVGLDLTGYLGHTLTVEFRVSDCFPDKDSIRCNKNYPGIHAAYAYIDSYCRPLTIDAPTVCVGASSVQLCAPPGYASYSWPSGQPGITGSPTTQCVTVNNPVAGTIYTVNMISVSGCPTSTSVTLRGIEASVQDTSLCSGQGGPINLSVTPVTSGTYTYVWKGPGGFTSNMQNPSIVPPAQTTTYSVTVTDSSGCSVSKSMTVNILPASVIVISPNVSICPGDSAILNASGATSYSWSPSSGLSSSNGGSVIAKPASSATYTVTGTTGLCPGTASVTVSVNSLPTIKIDPLSPSLCNGQSVSLTASGATTYSWAPSSGLSSFTGATVSANPSSTITYTVTGTDANGCSNTSSVAVTVNPLPAISANPSSPVICSGQSVLLTAAGAVKYSWNPSFGLSSASGDSVTATPSVTTTYIVTGTDANGCSGTSSVTVTINSSVVINVTPSSPNICLGASTSLTASGADSYSWNPSAGLSSSSGAQVTASPTNTTTYTVTGTTSGCTNTSSVTVIVNPLPAVNAEPDVFNCSNDSVQLAVSGSPPGSTYLWTPSSGLSCTACASPKASPDVTTDFIVEVTDSSGCQNQDSVTVNVIPFITSAGPDTAVCSGNFVQLQASGGTSYIWSPSTGLSDTTIANPVAFVFSTTTYSVEISSGSCNTSSAITIIAYPSPPTPDITQSNDTLLSTSDPSYISYQWYFNSMIIPGATNLYCIAKESGNYNMAVTDTNGCQISVGINIVLTAIAENNGIHASSIYVYPNPAFNVLNIVDVLNKNPNETAIFSIINMLGENVAVFKEENLTGIFNKQINIANLSSGVYFVKIQGKEGVAVRRFVKE